MGLGRAEPLPAATVISLLIANHGQWGFYSSPGPCCERGSAVMEGRASQPGIPFKEPSARPGWFIWTLKGWVWVLQPFGDEAGRFSGPYRLQSEPHFSHIPVKSSAGGWVRGYHWAQNGVTCGGWPML